MGTRVAVSCVTYLPTDAEASAGGGSAGDEWAGIPVKDNGGDSLNLCVLQPDGTTLAKTSVAKGTAKGDWKDPGVGA